MPHMPHMRDWPAIQRQGIKRFLISLLPYAGVVVLVAFGTALGVVQAAVGIAICALICLTQACFYGVLRSGMAVRSKDPLLAFPQVMFGIVLVSVGYASLDGLRSTALLWLSVIIVFDMRRLPPRQVSLATGLCVLLLALATLARAWWHPNGLNWFHEVFTLALLAVVLPALIAVSARARAVRERQVQQKEKMAQALAQLRQLSIRDGLTGLYNRRHMLEMLEDEVKRWQRAGHPFCVAILDIDLFKNVNDRFGHAVGDTVLQTFAHIGQKAFPGGVDVLARWGGEEFLLLLPQRTEPDAMAALAQLRHAVQSHDWSAHGSGLKVTFSGGVCEHREGCLLAQTLERADQALYRAKAAGRDRILTADYTRPHAPAEPRAASKPDKRPIDLTRALSASTPSAATAFQTESPRHPRAVWLRWLADLVMSSNPKVRAYQPMNLVAIAVYMACIAGFLLYVEPTHLLTHRQTMLFVAHSLLGAFVPYTLSRMGLTAHLRDPACTMLQLMWAGTALIVAYAMMPSLSATTLQMICLCIVFGFLDLRPRETQLLGRSYVAMMVCAFAARAALHPDGFDLHNEALEVAMACFVLLLLTLQSTSFSRTREHVRAEKRALAITTEQVNQLITRDALTGLFNRQHMQRILERECERHWRSGYGFCVALLDLDHFKRINDGYGHRVGDEALTFFAAATQAVLRETDVICRWGGEEFLVLMADTDPGLNAMPGLNRLREHIARQQVSAETPSLQLTFSAGVTEHIQDESLAAMLERADRALYDAKAAGRNRCVLAQASLWPIGSMSSDR